MKALAWSLLVLLLSCPALAQSPETSDLESSTKRYREPSLRAAQGKRLPAARLSSGSASDDPAAQPDGAQPSAWPDDDSFGRWLEDDSSAAFSPDGSVEAQAGASPPAPALITDYLSTGVFLLHAPPGLAYSIDSPTEGWCASGAPSTCEDQVNEVPASDEQEWVWYIISNFYAASTFRAVEYGIVYDADLYLQAAGEVCAPSAALTIEYPETGAWPQAGSGIAIALSSEPYWNGTMVATGMIHGWHYTSMPPATITLEPNPATNFAGWLGLSGLSYRSDCTGVLGIDTAGEACCAGPLRDGACCLSGGVCQVMSEEDCRLQGGEYEGDATDCDPNPCPQPGACCLADATCLIRTEPNCELEGGVFQGDATDCTPNPCQILPQGACCWPNGECRMRAAVVCEYQGGTYQGDDIDCTPNRCLIPGHGACCLPGGFCREITQEECVLQGGEYLGEGIRCDPHPCPLTPPGETFETAIEMGTLPFHAEGVLWDYTDDCDFGYGTSPDVIYKFTPSEGGCLAIDGCDSQYDQMIFVLDEALDIVAWNDDGRQCGTAASAIAWMPVEAGMLYYFVIDGYGGAAGAYDVDVTWRDCPPPPECPPGAILEGEGCADPYDDHYNGGCNSTPPVFFEVDAAPSTIVICGTTFNHYSLAGVTRRDTDWYYLVDLPELGATHVYATSYCESSGSLYFIMFVDPCTLGGAFGVHMGPRELGELSCICDPAVCRWCIFQAKNYYDPTWYPCTDPESWPYVLTIDGYNAEIPTPQATPTWGRVKSMFR